MYSSVIKQAIDHFIEDLHTSFEFDSLPQAKTKSIQGGIQISWGENSVFVLPFARNVNKKISIVLRNKQNTDVVQEAANVLSAAGVRVTKKQSTQWEQREAEEQTRQRIMQQANVEESLAAIRKDPQTYRHLLNKQENTISLSNSNFIDWTVEGQKIYHSDQIHLQLWMLHQEWSKHFELLCFEKDSSNLCVVPWIVWDVQNIYFGQDYGEVHNEQSFITNLFSLDGKDPVFLRVVENNEYFTLRQSLQLLFHFKVKSHTEGGYMMHRWLVEGKPEGIDESTWNKIQSPFHDILWDIRIAQHKC